MIYLKKYISNFKNGVEVCCLICRDTTKEQAILWSQMSMLQRKAACLLPTSGCSLSQFRPLCHSLLPISWPLSSPLLLPLSFCLSFFSLPAFQTQRWHRRSLPADSQKAGKTVKHMICDKPLHMGTNLLCVGTPRKGLKSYSQPGVAPIRSTWAPTSSLMLLQIDSGVKEWCL